MAMPPTELERAAAEGARRAPSRSMPPAGDQGLGQMQRRLNGLIRELRVEAQDLQRSLVEVTRTSTLADAGSRSAELHAALVEAAAIYDTADQHVRECLNDIRRLFDDSADLYDLAGDEVATMRALMQRVARTWPRLPASDDPRALDEAGAIHQATVAAGFLDEVVFHAGLVTIPIRLNAHLRELRIGGALRFDDMFADELPSEAARAKLLRYIGDHPATVDGLVDLNHGVIFRAARDPARRWASYGLQLLVFLLGEGVVYALTHVGEWFSLPDWPIPPTRFSELSIAYLFLALGAVVHTLVDWLKRQRDVNRSDRMTLGDLMVWLHVREMAVVTSILYLWIGVVGAAFALDNVAWQTAFFMGYSIDSVVDLFLQRFSVTATAATQAVRTQLGAPS
jgi:hypothetical protein